MCSCSGMAPALACIHLSVWSLVLAVTLLPTYLESHVHQLFSAGPRAGAKQCVDEAGPASESPVLRLSTHLTFRASVLPLLLLPPALLILELSVLGKAHSFSIASVSWSPMSHQAHRSFPAPLPILLPPTQLPSQWSASLPGSCAAMQHDSSILGQGSWGWWANWPLYQSCGKWGLALRTELGISWGHVQHPSPPPAQACSCQFHVWAEWTEEGRLPWVNPECFPARPRERWALADRRFEGLGAGL